MTYSLSKRCKTKQRSATDKIELQVMLNHLKVFENIIAVEP
jgi:hypothetical protein